MRAFGSGSVTYWEMAVSNCPLIVRATRVGWSTGSITTLNPTAAAWAWMNCASRTSAVALLVSRWTVIGVGKPDLATSFLAPAGSYGVQGTFVWSYQGVSAVGISVQLGRKRPFQTTLFR